MTSFIKIGILILGSAGSYAFLSGSELAVIYFGLCSAFAMGDAIGEICFG